ncbi:MAG: hypothetical protein GTO18_13455 [Anaerolineales bacterium]|nr:hypothetical protein [Anaerolineales bacterium]
MSNMSAGSRGLDLIRRFVNSEELTSQEMDAMRATMYLLAQYVSPAREWDEFQWKGVEHFIEKIWPEVQDRQDIRHGDFGDGFRSP